ncbi:MAG: T9SS type A sorting domain-containing protein [candidate division WOR-3 bacterium]
MRTLNKIHLVFAILSLFSNAYAQSKIVWLSYPTAGCITCHRIASVKMNDTLYLIGSFHYQNNKSNPFIIAIDSQLNVKWWVAFSNSNNITDLRIDAMVKINDSLVAISGGHSSTHNECPSGSCSFYGLFNIKTQNFIWAKYRQTPASDVPQDIRAIDFDGNNLIIGAGPDKGYSWFAKVDINNGNIIWQKSIGGDNEYRLMDGIYDGTGYVFLFCCKSPSRIVKVDTTGNLVWAKEYNFGSSRSSYKILKDVDGYIVIDFRCTDSGNCSTLSNDNILVFKTDFNGNIIWSKLYYTSLGGDHRAYNGTFDYDGNILISGFIRASNTISYPLVLKINRTNGNLIWARYWDTPPSGENSNMGKGVISIGPGKFYLITFIGNGTDASGGLAIIKEDTNPNLVGHCTRYITTFTTTNITPTISTLNPTISDANIQIYDLNLIAYNPSVNSTPSCEINTPISNYESYNDCEIKIYSRRNYLEILSSEEKLIKIYDVKGRLIYSRKVKGKEKVFLKRGIYIIKIDNKLTKIFKL